MREHFTHLTVTFGHPSCNVINVNESDWIAFFQDEGYVLASKIASGMDGTVFVLIPGELVAKIWHSRASVNLEQLKSFYTSLQNFEGALQTPSILEIYEVFGKTVTIEKFMAGTPLNDYLANCSVCEKTAFEATLMSLRFLKSIPPTTELRQLPLPGENAANCTTNCSWSDRILSLIAKRLEHFAPCLRQAVPEIDKFMPAVDKFLRARDSAPMSLVHGDLFGGNIMVNENIYPVGLIDFGHLTMIGDSAFDAGIASGIFDMYGPDAENTSARLIQYFEKYLGYSPKTMLAYRGIYALLTSNVYSAEGLDGHFRWSAFQLNSRLIRDALQIE